MILNIKNYFRKKWKIKYLYFLFFVFVLFLFTFRFSILIPKSWYSFIDLHELKMIIRSMMSFFIGGIFIFYIQDRIKKLIEIKRIVNNLIHIYSEDDFNDGEESNIVNRINLDIEKIQNIIELGDLDLKNYFHPIRTIKSYYLCKLKIKDAENKIHNDVSLSSFRERLSKDENYKVLSEDYKNESEKLKKLKKVNLLFVIKNLFN